MTTTAEFLYQRNADQLHYVIEQAKERIKHLKDRDKKEYLVLCDSYINIAFFDVSNVQQAVNRFTKETERQINSGNFEEMSLRIERHVPEDVADMLEVL